MASQKIHSAARYLEDLIDFFMRKYNIDWKPPYQLANDVEKFPKLFSVEIGETVFAISQSYQYRRIVEASKIYQFFTNEAAFYDCVFSMAEEFLHKPLETSFFHMSAFTAEVAVFCKKHSNLRLITTLTSAIICLCDMNLTLNEKKTRLYYQQMAKNIEQAKTERKLKENDGTRELTCEISRTESNCSNANIVEGESSFKDNYAIQTASQLHQSQNANSSNFQIGPPYNSNHFSGPQFAHTSLPGYPQGNVPEAGIPMYPIYHNVQFGYPSVPIPSWNHIEQQNIVNYVHPNFTSETSMASGTTVNSKYNVNHIPPTLSSSSQFPQFMNSFSLTNKGTSINQPSTQSSTFSTFADASRPKSKQKSQPLNVNAPVFIHSSTKQGVEGSLCLPSTSSEGHENTVSSSSEVKPKDCK